MKELAYTANLSFSKSKTGSYDFYRYIVFKILKKMSLGNLKIILPEGAIINFGEKSEIVSAEIKIKNNVFFKKCVLYGDIGFGESYVDGDWESKNITDVISWMILNIENAPGLSGGKKESGVFSLLKIINKIYHRSNINTLSGSKKNISAHYDLNNDFFKIFLDKGMTYSSALFNGEEITIEKAQENKYERLCRIINLKKEDKVLEIGSGWGGFAIYAARNYGCHVTTVTISREQFNYARNKIKEEGLDNRIEIRLMDYRKIEGTFDKIISIEMLEAVGHNYIPTFFKKCTGLLSKNGVLGLQVITSRDSRYESLRKNVDFIQKHIFPGSLLPSIAVINNAINKAGDLYMHDLKDFGNDYAKTLSIWRGNFNRNIEKVRELGFDNKFIRKWNYYLSYCEAAFKMKNIGVVQMVYTRPNNLSI